MMLELVNGQPPNLNKPVDLVCLHILALAVPEIEGDKWSPEMRDFLKICLIKDPYLRAGSEELLAHPWINKEKSPEATEQARQDFLKILLPFRKEKARKAQEEETVLIAKK